MPVAFSAKQRDQLVIDDDGALVAGVLGLLQSQSEFLRVLDCPLDPQRLVRDVEVRPLEGEDLVASQAGERCHSHDRKQGRSMESCHDRSELILIEWHPVVGFARGGDLLDSYHWIDGEQGLAVRRAEACPEHVMDMMCGAWRKAPLK